MRLFLFNPDRGYKISDIVTRVKESRAKVRKELSTLEKMGLIKRRNNSRGNIFSLNPGFSYLAPLENFLINTETLNSKEIIERITKLGSIKLLIVSGVFIHDPESRVDMLIVGDNVKAVKLEHTIKNLESEIGKELRYAYFSTNDFKYRLSVFDKLTRDILDYPHKKVLNRLGVL